MLTIELDKIKNTNRLNLIRTIQKKKTISSQQGHHHHHLDHQRKFTIDYYQPKKPFKQTLIPRKNYSLPKTLNSCYHQQHQPNIRNRKLIYSSQSKHNEHKSSNQNIFLSSIENQLHNKIDYSKNQTFSKALQLYKQTKYQKALHHFLDLQKQTQQKFSQNLYYIGLCYWELQLPEKAVIFMSKALNQGYQLSVQSYQLLSQFYQQTKNYNCALKTLDQWIKTKGNSKAYLMRARIYFQFKQYSKAINDYCECYRTQPTRLQAYIQQAQVTYKLLGIEAALQKYNHLLVIYKTIWPQSKHQDINYVKYKKSLLLIQQKNYDAALNLLKQVENLQMQSQVGYYIGIIYTILNDLQQATLAFTKAIQFNTSQKFVGQCYYQKFVIMFKKNDFYGIQHQFDMIGDKFPQNQPLQIMRKVIQATIYILKMNFQQGIKTFNSITQHACYLKNIKIYGSIVSSFKIFAFYSMHQFQQALEQFNNVKSKKALQSNKYNYTMLKAIKSAYSQNYNQSLQLFKQAQNIQPFNTHTFMVKAIVQIMFYNHLKLSKNTPQKQQDQTNQQILLSAQQLLNRCLQKQQNNDQILYILSSLNYELSQYQSGLKLVRKAIQVCDDYSIKHYYLKANLKILLGMIPQAIIDYSNAIQVMSQQQGIKGQQSQHPPQDPISQCYLQRAKCYIKQGQSQKAQSDLRIFFSNLTNVKKYASQLDLFMHAGCSNVILDIYKSILRQQYDPFNKMRCFYLAKQLNHCLNMMNILLQHDKQTKIDNQQHFSLTKLKFDRDCLEALKKSCQGGKGFIEGSLDTFQQKIAQKIQGDIFKKADCIFFAGVMSYLLQDYSKAKNYFIDAKGQKLLATQIANSQSQGGQQLQNQLFNLQQINYNIGICDFVQDKWSNYLDLYPAFKRQYQSIVTNPNQQKQIQQITPFQIRNRLCSIYPTSRIGPICFRLSFCLPKIKLPQVKFQKNCNIINSITLKDLDMRPSAPWIQKSKKGIIFTSQVLNYSIDLKSEKSRKNHNQKKKGHQRYKETQQH